RRRSHARTRATSSSAPRPRRSPICRRAPPSAPRRCGARRPASGRAAIPRSVPCAGTWGRTRGNLPRAGGEPSAPRPPALDRAGAARTVIPVDDFLPAVGQGIIAIEARGDDERTLALLAAVNHADTAAALTAERAFLTVLEGSCRTPIAGHAVVAAGRLRFR